MSAQPISEGFDVQPNAEHCGNTNCEYLRHLPYAGDIRTNGTYPFCNYAQKVLGKMEKNQCPKNKSHFKPSIRACKNLKHCELFGYQGSNGFCNLVKRQVGKLHYCPAPYYPKGVEA